MSDVSALKDMDIISCMHTEQGLHYQLPKASSKVLNLFRSSVTISSLALTINTVLQQYSHFNSTQQMSVFYFERHGHHKLNAHKEQGELAKNFQV